MALVNNYIRREPKDKLNILTFPTHERYETNLAKTGHSFYSYQDSRLKAWDMTIDPPSNYYLMPVGQFYPRDGYDLILAQSRFGQFQIAHEINKSLNIPIIALEHTTPTPDLSQEVLKQMGQMQGDVNVFISNYSANQWVGLGIERNVNVIEHCVDTKVFQPKDVDTKERDILTVANNFAKRDYCLNYGGWERITQGLPIKLIGDNPGLSEPVVDADGLANEYNKAQVYLNTSTHSPIPMSLLEAMACGCAVVSTATCAIPDIVTHVENGLISNDEAELREFCQHLLDTPEEAARLGRNARATIEKRFSTERFVSEWNEILTKTYEASL